MADPQSDPNLAAGSVLHLSLISHTNVGKTTLARTLLRRDVGEVLDRAHVTLEPAAYELITAGPHRLELWDTPGFGDSIRLLRRLHTEQFPIRWFLQQTWDRFTDRAFWSGQQAVLHLREQAHIVLYLVNAMEHPSEAGYVDPELELLGWMGRPVLLLLNQTGPAGSDTRAAERAWRDYAQRYEVVKDVLTLDAFTRCWVQENELLRRVQAVLPAEKQPVMAALADAWEARNQEIFRRSLGHVTTYLATTATDREALTSKRPSKVESTRAMQTLAERLEAETRKLMDRLIREHGLEGRSEAKLYRQLDDVLLQGTTKLSTEQGAFWGGLVSGALGGLMADFLAGGLTFGGGAVAGAILGVLGGAGLSRAHELIQFGGEPAASWSSEFLHELLRQSLLRYLAVAHFGRGRGVFEEGEMPEVWRREVDAVLQKVDVKEMLKTWRRWGKEDRGLVERELGPQVERWVSGVLGRLYR